jgi:hypothetical protein
MGDVPSWLAAIGTVGAFGVALYLLGVQMRDRREETQDRRMAQARLVAAWLSEMVPTGVASGAPPTSLIDYVVLVRNGSDQPVYALVVKLAVGVRGTFVRQMGELGPLETRELRIKVPGEPRSLPETSIMFGDSGSRVWMRSGRGKLTNPTAAEGQAHFDQDPGAYSFENHPTLALGNTVDGQQGTRVRYP